MKRITGLTLAMTLIAPVPFAAAQQGGVYINQGNVQQFQSVSRQNAMEAAELEFAAIKALEEAKKDEARIAAIKEEIRVLESDVAKKRTILTGFEREEALAMEKLHHERGQYSAAFSAMIALSRAQGPLMVAYRGDPVRSARGAVALEGLRGSLKLRAAQVQSRLSEIKALRSQTEIAREETRQMIESLRDRDRQLWALIGKNRELSRTNMARVETLRMEAEDMSRQSHRLTSLIARSPVTAPAPRPAMRNRAQIIPANLRTPTEAAKGNLLWPVMGSTAVQRYGDTTTKREALGYVIDAAAFSKVSAPWDGIVSYAGPVDGLNLVTVIDINGKYQLILAGLASVERKVGDRVLRGEPVGRLGGPVSRREEFLAENSAIEGAALSSLYLQVRVNGDPVDPEPWLEPSALSAIRKAEAE